MPNLIISEILLYSTKEKAAKRVKFSPSRTVIHGKNDTGKSCLIKSIYQAFGATPAKVNPKWKNVQATILLHFKVDGINYSILKEGKYYAVFDGQGMLVNVFDSVVNGLGVYLANLLNFRIKLPNQENEIITPPPAFIFLPFYVDQDVSWNETWSSFSSLAMIKSFREPIVYYHTGIRPNEYYDTKAEITNYFKEIEELEQDRKVSQNILNNIKEKLSTIDFNIDVEIFKEEVKDLIIECEKLKKKEERHKENLVELHNNKLVIEAHIEIAKEALKETQKDYSYADRLDEHSINCPTCGAEYENSFIDRFEIAQDTDKCKELLKELNAERFDIENKIQKENSLLNRSIEEIERIEHLLQKTKGELQLRDIIENEGRNEIKKLFDERLAELNFKIQENAIQQEELKRKLASLEDKQRRETILGEYQFSMAKYLRELEVMSLTSNDYKNIAAKINDTGSSKARALISYYYSVLNVIQKYSTSCFCPIVIDSPNQQAQDIEHIDKILKFVKDNQPSNSQLILGLEELYDIDFDCEMVELTNKYHLLQDSAYEEVGGEISPYLDKLYASKGLF